MPDVDMGSTETSATAIALISSMVQMQLIAEAKIMFTVQDESARATKGASSVKFPRTGALDPVAKVENTASYSQALTYAGDTLSLNQHTHTFVRLEDIADVQSVVDVKSDIIERAGKGMAKAYDTYIYGLLKAGASASAPDHIVDHYSSSALITRAKILEARKLLDRQDVPDSDRFCIISPEQEAELLNIDGFVDADKYGARTALLNGEVGQLFGFRFIKTSVCEDNVTLYYHKSACAFARQIEPKWETMRNLSLLADEYSLSTLYGAKVLDSGKRLVVANGSGS